MARKTSSDKLSSLAARTLTDKKASRREKRLAASVLSQDEDSSTQRAIDELDASHAAEVQARCRRRTEEIAAGKIRKRVVVTPPGKRRG